MSELDVELSYMDKMDKGEMNTAVFRVGVVLVDGFPLISYSGVIEPLLAANRVAGRALYSVRHMPALGARAISSSGAIVSADTYLGEHVDFDLVLVVAGSDHKPDSLRRLEHWLRLLASRSVLVGGVSAGPLILARAGIMEGYRLTVHTEQVPLLHSVSANLIVEHSKVVRDRGRLTCTGGMASMDMMLFLISEHHQSQLAESVSDLLNHNACGARDSSPLAGVGQRHKVDNPHLIKAIQAMENHVYDPLTLTQISELAGISARQVNRLFKQQLRQSTLGYYTQLRLKKSRSLLHETFLSINQIAQATGFGSSAYFSRQYRRLFNKCPTQCRAEHKCKLLLQVDK